MATYRFTGFDETEFVNLPIGRAVQPGEQFELDDDVAVDHAYLERLDGGSWVPTREPAPEPEPVDPDAEPAPMTFMHNGVEISAADVDTRTIGDLPTAPARKRRGKKGDETADETPKGGE